MMKHTEKNQRESNMESCRIKFVKSEISRIVIGHSQSVGKRSYQEDSFGYTKPADYCGSFTAVVADGMGGLSNGSEISAYVVERMLQMSRRLAPGVPVHAELTRIAQSINSNFLNNAAKSGSTLAAVYCNPDGIFWCCVGDSRVYLFRRGRLTQLNEDTDYLNVLFRKVLAGELTYQQAALDPQKDSLAQYIGRVGQITPDCNRYPLIPEKNDKILICSDGIYNSFTDDELAILLSLPAQTAADAILRENMEKNKPGQDNFTAVILEFKEI